jgi:hypothetical protein
MHQDRCFEKDIGNVTNTLSIILILHINVGSADKLKYLSKKQYYYYYVGYATSLFTEVKRSMKGRRLLSIGIAIDERPLEV